MLIAEELYDKQYVADRTEGFEELKAMVAKYTPEVTAGITGVPADDIREAARILSANRPGALIYAMGITQHTTGHQNVLSCANLQMLLGNGGEAGGGVNPCAVRTTCRALAIWVAGQLLHRLPEGHGRACPEQFQQAWGKTGSLKVADCNEMINAPSAAGERVFILGENPVTDPDTNHARRAQSKRVLVVQEILPSETTPYADILPGTSFAEKSTFTNTERRVQMVRPAIQCPGQARPDWEILADLGRRIQQRLGMSASAAPYASWEYSNPKQIMEEVAALTPIYGGITYERIDKAGLQWPCPTKDHPGTKFLHKDKFSRGLSLERGECCRPTKCLMPSIRSLTTRVLFHFVGAPCPVIRGLDAIYPKRWWS